MLRSTRRRLASVLATAVVLSLGPVLAAPAYAVLAAPNLTAPDEGVTVGGNPVFAWDPVAGATKYRIQFSTSDAFTSISETADTFNVTYAPKTTLPVGTVHWRVAALSGTTPQTYANRSFVRSALDAPQLVAPADGTTLNYPDEVPLFRWNAMPGIKTYEIHIDDAPDFVGATVATTPNTSYALPDQQPIGQPFYWRVLGKTANNINSPLSATWSYSIAWPEVPTLVRPVSQTVEDVVFEWTAVRGAAGYELSYSTAQDFTPETKLVVKHTRYSPAVTLDNNTYYWRVRPLDSDAPVNYGSWSETGQFTRAWSDKPVLLTPANGAATVTLPTLRWTPVDHASYYRVEISSDENFTSVFACTTVQTSYTPHDPYQTVAPNGTPGYPSAECTFDETKLAVGTPTYWRVKALDAPRSPAVNGIYSEPSSFIYKHPSLPFMTAPGSGESVEVPTLEWTAVTGSAKYKVFLYNSGGTAVSGFPMTTYATSLTPPDGLPVGNYTWTVVTLDDQNRSGLVQDVRSFTVVAPAEGGPDLTLLTPSDGAAGIRMPKMSWTRVTGATKYNLFYSIPGSGVKHEFVENGEPVRPVPTSYTYSGLPLASGAYDWWVEARDNANTLLALSAVSQFVVDQMALATNIGPANCTQTAECDPETETPLLEWNAVPGAGGYVVYIAEDAAFTNVVRGFRTQFTSLTSRDALPDNAAGSAYYWFARPCRQVFPALLGCGRFDNTTFPTAYAFRKRSPSVSLVSPAHGAQVPASGVGDPANVTFSWTDYYTTSAAAVPPAGQSGMRYRIEVSVTDSFPLDKTKLPIVDHQYVDQTTYTPHGKTYPEGPLYWHVQAIDASGNELPWSETRLITKATPTLATQTPVAGSTEPRAPYFTWAAQAHAAKYEFELYKNADTEFSAPNKVTLTGTSPKIPAYSPNVALAAGSYAWRVRRVDANTPAGLAGPWSSGGVFHVGQAATTLISPADAASPAVTGLTFTWAPVAGATAYRFEASVSSAFSSTLEKVDTVGTTWAPILKYPDGTIYWRVSVLDSAGQVISTSAYRTITLDGTLPTVTGKPASGAPITGPFTVTFSEPVTGVSGSTFKLAVAGTPNLVNGAVAMASSSAARFTPAAPLVPGESYTFSLTGGITDLRGNALAPLSWTVRTATLIDDLSPAVTEGWDRDTSSYANGGGYLANGNGGAKVQFTFTGTSAAVVGRRAVDGGYADIYVDGVKQNTTPVTFFHSTGQWKVNVWSKSGFSNTTHRLEVRVLGTRPSTSRGTFVYVDGFRYGASYAEETHAGVKTWWRSLGATSAYGRSHTVENFSASGDTGTKPFVQTRFRGTKVVWKGFKGPGYGVALVYVDNRHVGTVDLWSSSNTAMPLSLWTSAPLTNAQHTLRIYVNGSRRTGATGFHVSADVFAVT